MHLEISGFDSRNTHAHYGVKMTSKQKIKEIYMREISRIQKLMDDEKDEILKNIYSSEIEEFTEDMDSAINEL